MLTSAEHLVIGSGAGGALTAALLAEAGRDVLVIEDGPFVAVGEIEPFSLEQVARQYRNGGLTAALGHPAVAYVEGRCVGGGTEVNAGLYHAPGAELLARWRRSHAVGDLTPESVAPFISLVESGLAIQELPGPASPASRLLADGATALGWSSREVPRWYRYVDGVPVRQSMTRTFIPRALAAGARVLADTRAARLTFRNGRVTGVRTGEDLITAEHVWVCAGAIGSAALLRRSGIRGAVGASLSMHPTIKAVARFHDPVGAATDIPVHQVKPPDERISIGGAISRPGYVALGLAEDWASGRAIAEEPDHLASYYAAIRPHGRGRVVVVPTRRDPLVTFALTREDMTRLGTGLRSLCELLLAAGARSVHPGVPGGGTVRPGDRLDHIPSLVTRGTASLMTLHLCSTLPMGEDPTRCPVDSHGRVRGIAGLRVNDASLLPDAPGVNPQGTVMAIAARNVAQFLG